MHLVDDHPAKVAEESHEVARTVEHQSFERLGRDLQYPARLLEERFLLSCRHVTMPCGDRNIGLDAEIAESQELVVDQCLERADVEHADGRGRVLMQLREDRQERRLGLAARRTRRQQQVLVRVECRSRRAHLHVAHLVPAVLPDELLDERREAIEGGRRTRHQSVNSLNLSSAPLVGRPPGDGGAPSASMSAASLGACAAGVGL